MTRQELAAKLHGRAIGEEITKAEAAEAKRDGLLVVFGASDDLCELDGAIYDEVGVCDGRTFRISSDLKVIEEPDSEELAVLKKFGFADGQRVKRDGALAIEAVWDQGDIAWTYKTDAPYSTFDILEDEYIYCRGIVIDMKEAFAEQVKR